MWFSERSFFAGNILERFIAFAGLKRDLKILEIGCGAGRYSIPLIKSGYQLTGIDISERMLKKFREDAAVLDLKGFELICADLDHFDPSPGQFDLIIGFNVLHHLYDVEDHLRKLLPCLRTGGTAAFLEPHAGNPLHMIDTILDRGWQAEKNKSKSTPENIQAVFQRNNLRQVAYEQFGFFPPFLIDAFPLLLNVERSWEKKAMLKKIAPYFMVRGTK